MFDLNSLKKEPIVRFYVHRKVSEALNIYHALLRIKYSNRIEIIYHSDARERLYLLLGLDPSKSVKQELNHHKLSLIQENQFRARSKEYRQCHLLLSAEISLKKTAAAFKATTFVMLPTSPFADFVHIKFGKETLPQKQRLQGLVSLLKFDLASTKKVQQQFSKEPNHVRKGIWMSILRLVKEKEHVFIVTLKGLKSSKFKNTTLDIVHETMQSLQKVQQSDPKKSRPIVYFLMDNYSHAEIDKISNMLPNQALYCLDLVDYTSHTRDIANAGDVIIYHFGQKMPQWLTYYFMTKSHLLVTGEDGSDLNLALLSKTPALYTNFESDDGNKPRLRFRNINLFETSQAFNPGTTNTEKNQLILSQLLSELYAGNALFNPLQNAYHQQNKLAEVVRIINTTQPNPEASRGFQFGLNPFKEAISQSVHTLWSGGKIGGLSLAAMITAGINKENEKFQHQHDLLFDEPEPMLVLIWAAGSLLITVALCYWLMSRLPTNESRSRPGIF